MSTLAPARPGWRTRAVRVGAGVAIVAVIVGGGVAAYAAHADGADTYRTATASIGDVEQAMALSGTVDPSGRSDLAFATSGTVSRLRVAVGDKVVRGEVLATLDTTALKAAVTQANAQLAAARAQLAKDEDAQTTALSTASPTTSSTTPASGGSGSAPTTAKTPATSSGTGTPSAGQASTPGSSSGPSAALAKALAQLGAQQHAVEVAQTAVDTAIVASQDALKQEQTLCAGASSSSSSSADDSASAEPSADASTAAAPDSGTDTSGTDACEAAIASVQTTQQAVAAAEYSGSGNLKDALAALSTTLTSAAKAASSAGSTSAPGGASASATKATSTIRPTTGGQQQTKSTQSAQTGASQAVVSTGRGASSGVSGGQTVTAATLAKDQASIDTARASLVKASQALTGATIKAPATGTVGQVSITRGGSVSSGGTAIVVIAPGTTTVAIDASSTQVAELEVGQHAEITPAGASRAYAGRVTLISRIPTSGSTGSSTYPVTVTLDDKGLSLLAGATASVDITLGQASGVVTVPTSAVSNGSVEVYNGGKVSRVRVTTGLVGRSRTVISDGLKAGQQVVLADLSSALPTGGSSGTTHTFGGASFAGGSFSGSGGPPSGGIGGGGFGG